VSLANATEELLYTLQLELKVTFRLGLRTSRACCFLPRRLMA
jgi:hypothetical protein